MASLKTKFAVGIFVLIGFVMIIAALIWLGMSHYLERGKLYAAYFDESVQGLSRDSAVKYRGVSIGRVERIGVAPDANLIEAILKIDTGMQLEADMVAQLKSVGITGIVFVEIDRKKPGEPDLSPPINFRTKYPSVKTKPSGMKLFLGGINDLMEQIRRLNVIGFVDQMRTTLVRFNSALNDAQIEGIATDFRRTLKKAETILQTAKWLRLMDSAELAADAFGRFSNNADQTVADLGKTVLNLDEVLTENKQKVSTLANELLQAVRNADTLFDKGAVLMENSDDKLARLESLIAKALFNFEKAGDNLNHLVENLNDNLNGLVENLDDNLNNFVENLDDNPARLLLSRPPPARIIEPDRQSH